MKAIKSIKQVFESDNVILTKVLQGRNGIVRIDAKTRFRVPDMDNNFSEWCTEKYASKLYGKPISQSPVYKY
jgi:hypothetical protein